MSEKWGVIGIPVTRAGEVLVMPGLAENRQKKERVVGYENHLTPVLGSEFLGGAVDVEDAVFGETTLVLALLREAAEERGLILSPGQLIMSFEGYEVQQVRLGKPTNFLVACYIVNLIPEQEEWLRACGAVNYTSSDDLRPRDAVIGREFVANYLVPTVVGVEI